MINFSHLQEVKRAQRSFFHGWFTLHLEPVRNCGVLCFNPDSVPSRNQNKYSFCMTDAAKEQQGKVSFFCTDWEFPLRHWAATTIRSSMLNLMPALEGVSPWGFTSAVAIQWECCFSGLSSWCCCISECQRNFPCSSRISKYCSLYKFSCKVQWSSTSENHMQLMGIPTSFAHAAASGAIFQAMKRLFRFLPC